MLCCPGTMPFLVKRACYCGSCAEISGLLRSFSHARGTRRGGAPTRPSKRCSTRRSPRLPPRADLEREARDAGRATADDPEGGRLLAWPAWRRLAAVVRRAPNATSQAEAKARSPRSGTASARTAARSLKSRTQAGHRSSPCGDSGDPVRRSSTRTGSSGQGGGREQGRVRRPLGRSRACASRHRGEIDRCWMPALDRRALPLLPASHPALRWSSIPCDDPLPPRLPPIRTATPHLACGRREPAPRRALLVPSCGGIQHCSPACLAVLSRFHTPQCSATSAAPPLLEGTVLLPPPSPSRAPPAAPPNPHCMRARSPSSCPPPAPSSSPMRTRVTAVSM
ncbi:hypothetical protein DFJ74DRAFT_407941 [Hyaloraphidium curvatum]|nr:hypothetical protein DFJ74DRAFT_407941 [Hyaloraphidium curvatum]